MATITGTRGSDVLQGTSSNDQISGLEGNDTIIGSGGSDRLDGGPGSDTVDYSQLTDRVQIDLTSGAGKGQGGTDTIISIGNAIGTQFGDDLTGNPNDNLLQGGPGDDFLIGGAGNDTLDGGPGSDSLFYYSSPAGVSVDLGAGVASDGFGTTDRIVSVGLLQGSSHDDILTGNDNYNRIDGGEGDDRLYGRGGDDYLDGGRGNDLIDGGEGSDTVSYLFANGPVTVNLATGVATDGEGSWDSLVSVGNVVGTPFDADVLIGNDNANSLSGLAGANTLTGNGGPDLFVMESWDWWGSRISDFHHGEDKISVSLRSTPVGGYSSGPLDPFRFTTGTPSGNDWTFQYQQSTGTLLFDTDGAGPNMPLTVATLLNNSALTASDITLV